jgi:hypothetical protein
VSNSFENNTAVQKASLSWLQAQHIALTPIAQYGYTSVST